MRLVKVHNCLVVGHLALRMLIVTERVPLIFRFRIKVRCHVELVETFGLAYAHTSTGSG